MFFTYLLRIRFNLIYTCRFCASSTIQCGRIRNTCRYTLIRVLRFGSNARAFGSATLDEGTSTTLKELKVLLTGQDGRHLWVLEEHLRGQVPSNSPRLVETGLFTDEPSSSGVIVFGPLVIREPLLSHSYGLPCKFRPAHLDAGQRELPQ